MINAVRNLQVVQKPSPKSSPEDVVIKEATNDKPISSPSGPSETSASKPSSAAGESV
jgi:hypothetical protein